MDYMPLLEIVVYMILWVMPVVYLVAAIWQLFVLKGLGIFQARSFLEGDLLLRARRDAIGRFWAHLIAFGVGVLILFVVRPPL